MKQSYLACAALAAFLLLPAPESQASSMYCGTHLIQGGGRHGPTMYEVLKKCGEPKERHAYTWIYKMRGKVWQLRFSSNGILLTISRGD